MNYAFQCDHLQIQGYGQDFQPSLQKNVFLTFSTIVKLIVNKGLKNLRGASSVIGFRNYIRWMLKLAIMFQSSVWLEELPKILKMFSKCSERVQIRPNLLQTLSMMVNALSCMFSDSLLVIRLKCLVELLIYKIANFGISKAFLKQDLRVTKSMTSQQMVKSYMQIKRTTSYHSRLLRGNCKLKIPLRSTNYS